MLVAQQGKSVLYANMGISSLSVNGQPGILMDGHRGKLHHSAGSNNPSLLVLGLNRIILSVKFVLVGSVLFI